MRLIVTELSCSAPRIPIRSMAVRGAARSRRERSSSLMLATLRMLAAEPRRGRRC